MGLGATYYLVLIRFQRIIVLFKSLRKYKKRNKGSFKLKPNSNEIMLCGGGGQHYLVLNKISTYYLIFYVSLQFLSELNNIF